MKPCHEAATKVAPCVPPVIFIVVGGVTRDVQNRVTVIKAPLAIVRAL